MRSSLAVSVLVFASACGPESSATSGNRYEICSNQKDDNGDGKTDCADPQCFDSRVCSFEGAGGAGGAGGGSAGGSGGGTAGGGGTAAGSGGGTAGGSGGGTAGGSGGGTAGGSGGGTAGGAGGGTAGGAGGGTAGGAGGGTAGGAGGAGGGTAGGSGGGTAGGAGGGTAGGAGGGAPSPCAAALTNPSSATDQQLWTCGTSTGQLGSCSIDTNCASCVCASYVRSTKLCTAGSCGAPINGTGCSDKAYYAGAPFNCSGDKVTQSACMLRYLIQHGHCASP